MSPTTLVQEASRKVKEGGHELAILTGGDMPIVSWDPMDEATTAKAKELFDRAMSAGGVGYSAPAQGEAEVVRSFDPNAEHLIVQNPLVGG